MTPAEIKALQSMTQCRGLMGKLRGHKFHRSTLEWEYGSDTCYRCGVDQETLAQVRLKLVEIFKSGAT